MLIELCVTSIESYKCNSIDVMFEEEFVIPGALHGPPRPKSGAPGSEDDPRGLLRVLDVAQVAAPPLFSLKLRKAKPKAKQKARQARRRQATLPRRGFSSRHHPPPWQRAPRPPPRLLRALVQEPHQRRMMMMMMWSLFGQQQQDQPRRQDRTPEI